MGIGLDTHNNASSDIDDLRQQIAHLQQELVISQKERAEALEHRKRLTHCLALANIGYWECDLATQEFIFNDEIYQQVYKTSVEEVGSYRMPVIDYVNQYVHPADREWTGSNIQKALTSSDPLFRLEHRVIFGDKSEGFLLVSFQVVRDEQGAPTMLFGICQDTSLLKQREHELRRFADILEQTNDLVSIISIEGKPNYINPAGRTLLQIENEADTHAINSITTFCGHEDNVFEQAIAKTVKEGSWSGEVLLRNRNHETVPVWLILLAHRDIDGSIDFISVIARDLSLAKQAEAALRQNISQEEQLRAQQATLRELSTPLIPLTDDLVVMPIIGTIDSSRAQQIIEVLLEGINTYGSSTAILDITGVKVIDTQVADALIRAAQAARLLGSRVILTGISPEVAQTLVHLSIDLAGIITHRDLRDSLRTLFA